MMEFYVEHFIWQAIRIQNGLIRLIYGQESESATCCFLTIYFVVDKKTFKNIPRIRNPLLIWRILHKNPNPPKILKITFTSPNIYNI